MMRVDWPSGLAPNAREQAQSQGFDPAPTDRWSAVASVRCLGDPPPPGPTLWLVAASDLQTALTTLRSQDDLVVLDAPAALMLHRLDRLARDGLRLDGLTGLFTREVFRERNKAMLTEASAVSPMSLIVVDIDHFKRLNDTHGHVVGDAVLVEIARRIENVVPRFCLCCRIAGDEYGVSGPMDEEQATEVARQIHAAVQHPVPVEGGRRSTDAIVPTASIGVASTSSGIELEAWRSAAYDACYAVKARGRNGLAHQAALEREALEQDRDPMMVGFENLTQVVSERVGELIRYRGRRLFASLRSEADHDALTGLHGRRYLDRRVPFELDEAREAGSPLTLALLDLDHFGRVNKKYGWVAGDAVLREAANRVRTATRESDWVARYGGEEIALVLGDTSVASSEQVLSRVRLALADRPFELPDGSSIRVTASIGAADSTERKGSSRDVFDLVGERLLLAKSGGRNRVVLSS